MNNTVVSDNDRSNDGSNEGIVNWVALVVSLVALLGTFAQVLQQYIASAAGYSNCGESVMGRWHETKKRKFRVTELRFEVQFETPVIFVCAPNNTKGPIKGKPIHFVDGTSESLKHTRALLPVDEEAQRQSLQEGGVHTADNERASWVILLSQLQSMEKDSREWHWRQFNCGPPHGAPPADSSSHTLAVAVQAKKRSWDTMPAGVKKPYATTAMCHLLEIAALMGIYWKEFDRSRDKYRGEGNGYMLTGSSVSELGVVFTLQICGKSRFHENRVIPVDEVKELCCGLASTLFQGNNKDRRRVEFPNEDPKDLSFLRLGSMDEIAETMVLIECNTDTATYFRSDSTKHSHLFPVPFELLGMLGKTLHIRNSAFRMLPNPTPYHWDKNFFNIRRLIVEYGAKIDDSDAELPQTEQVEQLRAQASELASALEADKKSKTPGYSIPLLNKLHDVLDRCDGYLRDANRDLVRIVIREHFQEVMKLINEDRGGGDGDGHSKIPVGRGKPRAEHFDELTAASPEERQRAFMELYFFKVFGQVRERALTSYQRRRSTYYPSAVHSREPSIDSVREEKMPLSVSPSPSPSPSGTPSRPISPAHPASAMKWHESGQLVPMLQLQPPDRSASHRYLPATDSTSDLEGRTSEIWCTLILRMLCWLLLHDFNKNDVQIAKSELLGSRLPVYIA